MNIQDRVVISTGASNGIGAATSLPGVRLPWFISIRVHSCSFVDDLPGLASCPFVSFVDPCRVPFRGKELPARPPNR